MKLLFAVCLLLSIALGAASGAWHRKFVEQCNTHCREYSYPLYKNEGIMECCSQHTDDDAALKDWLCHRNTAICIYE